MMDKKMESRLVDLYEHTDTTIVEIAKEIGSSTGPVQRYIVAHYTEDERYERKTRTYGNSKLGDKNPMTGLHGDLHPNYKGEVSDGRGYIMILKPEWYTGRKGSRHVFVHTVMMCEALGLTELPAGFIVHHVDEDPTHNDLDNFALMTVGAHTRLHQRERATTIPKGSR
jgi:hypothetical protein